MTSVEERIIPVTESGCWLWQGSTTGRGYGDFRSNGTHWLLHRFMWLKYKGPIPEGMHVLHMCDVRLCCNPDHLFLGTNADNIQDSMNKGRRKGVTRKRPSGLRYNHTKTPGPAPKLNSEQRQAMIEEYLRGGVSKSALARKYGVSTAAVCRRGRGYLAGLA